MRRLQAESDAKIEEALANVESETRSRAERDAEGEVKKRIDAARREAGQEAERNAAEREAALAAELEEAERALQRRPAPAREAEAGRIGERGAAIGRGAPRLETEAIRTRTRSR